MREREYAYSRVIFERSDFEDSFLFHRLSELESNVPADSACMYICNARNALDRNNPIY